MIETENVDVAYQPIIDLRTDRCLGVEALARFPTPFSKTDHTLAVSADVGLSLELERLMVRRAWEMLDQLAPGQLLSLNLTPGALLELARRANQRDDLPLEKLVVEVTEHAAVDSYAPSMTREQATRRCVTYSSCDPTTSSSIARCARTWPPITRAGWRSGAWFCSPAISRRA